MKKAPTVNSNNGMNPKLYCEPKDSISHVQRCLSDTDQRYSSIAMKQHLGANNEERKSLGHSQCHEGTLKHYDGQVNLFELKGPTEKHSAKDTVFETIGHDEDQHTESLTVATLLPTMQRRYKRQPTIENTVCFQEVKFNKWFLS